MKKYFLLIAGDQYYPCSGTRDWKETFETYAEAEIAAEAMSCDWYDIVDLQQWIGSDETL
jgi:hypothetical protein